MLPSKRMPLGGGGGGIEYELVLETRNIKTDEMWNDIPASIFTLKLIEVDNSGFGEKRKTFILQQDKKLPRSRGYVLGYGIQSVYVFKKHVAVFLSYSVPGFEGADVRQMVVTGILP